MPQALSLIDQLKRRVQYLNRNRGYRRQDKINLSDETLVRTPVFQLLRGIQRRLDKMLGLHLQPSPLKNLLEDLVIASEIQRVVVGLGHKLQVTVSANGDLEPFIGVQPNDVVEILSGSRKGHQYTVTAVVDSHNIQLEDDATFGSAQMNVPVKIRLFTEKRSYN